MSTKGTSYLSGLIRNPCLCYHCPHEKLAVPAAEAPWSPVALQGCAVAGSCALELVLTGRVGNRSPAVLAQRPLLGACGRQLGAQGWGHGLQEQTLHQHSLTPSVHCTANTMPALLLSHPLPTRRLHFSPLSTLKTERNIRLSTYPPINWGIHITVFLYFCTHTEYIQNVITSPELEMHVTALFVSSLDNFKVVMGIWHWE